MVYTRREVVCNSRDALCNRRGIVSARRKAIILADNERKLLKVVFSDGQ